MDESTKKDLRTRNWTFVLYPESAPADWRTIIDGEHVPWVESPLHDMDTLEDGSGEVKKAHWHVILLYDGKKSFEQIKAITEKVHGTIPQKVANVKGLVRYCAHLDNPEKFQYSTAAIVGHGGADVADLLRPTSADRYKLISEMCEYIKQNHVTEFCDMMYYAKENRNTDWFPMLCDNSAYVIGQVIKSERHKGEISK